MVERADINSVLMQMRAIKQQVQTGAEAGVSPVVNPHTNMATEKADFGNLLKSAVDKVHEVQLEAKNLTTAYEKGDPTVDLPEVMISMQKASVSFEALTQVRNRVVRAYEDVMKMPI
ncbi:flagellar hook-basal body complex protein FliE [Marinobacterium jannaschii]|uniref:flagellar hook-basal body complex protein FliE n=1 Tax=Marinobacterium jannaschii TaxID=64970 RepID=UPI0004887EA7|nr:flagellar hook-basal body complex protein FliE [Marinobacterium jannaschii]